MSHILTFDVPSHLYFFWFYLIISILKSYDIALLYDACSKSVPWTPTKAEHQDDNKKHFDYLLSWLLHPDRIALLLNTTYSFDAKVQIGFILVISYFDRGSSALFIFNKF